MTASTVSPKISFKDRIVSLARGKHAEWALFGVSFAESSFFPIPPDPLLGLMAGMEPRKWLRYAILCTIASVLGGLFGYAIGMFLFEAIGQHILNFFGYGDKEAELRALYDQWGALLIFIKGLTPIPYKLVTILSGALAYNLPMFIIASIITRGGRFLLVAWLFQRFGPAMGPVIEKRLGLFMIGVAAVIVLGIVALRFIPH